MLFNYPYFDLWHRYACWLHAGLAVMLSLSMCLASRMHDHASKRPMQHMSTPVEYTNTVLSQTPRPAPQHTLLTCEPEPWLDQAADLHLQWQHWSYKGHDKKAGIAEVTGRWENCTQWLDALTTHNLQLDRVTLTRDHHSQSSHHLHLSCHWHCVQHHNTQEIAHA